ncbi:MAG: efflux RND transporter periplasmic adaptor subunit [Longimicrobiales bacterium]
MSMSGSPWLRMFAQLVIGATLIGVGFLGAEFLPGREPGQVTGFESSSDEHAIAAEDEDGHSLEDDGDEDDAHEEEGADLVELSPAALTSIGLTTDVVTSGTVETTQRVPGAVRMHPDGIAILSTRIRGKIVSVTAAPGDRVKRGQVLVRIQSLVPGNPPPTVDVNSPIAGVVARRDAILGEAAQPDKELFRIIDPRRVVAEGLVPERLIGRVRLGQVARFHRLRDDRSWTGRVTFIGSEADPETRTYPVWVEMSSGDGALPRPGQFGAVHLIESTRTAVTVPQGAIVDEGPLHFVFVQHDQGFERRLVRVGAEDAQNVEILSGVEAGETVAVTGSYELLLALQSGGTGALDAESAPHEH